MQPADLEAVMSIEMYAYDFPWSRQIFSDCLMAGYPAVVLDGASGLIGYAILSTAAAEAHILNLCIDPDYQRQGFGRLLLDYLLDCAIELEVERLFLEVRPSNVPAITLYEQADFTRLGTRKSYYRADEGREDALVLVREMF
jgi:ribosomal-protein-alanine N-acetyltransferase